MPFTGGEGPAQVIFFGKTAYIVIPFQSNDITYLFFLTTYVVCSYAVEAVHYQPDEDHY